MFKPEDGQTVACPADRGDEPYKGTVMSAGDVEQRSHRGEPFVWVSVRHPRGHSVVWPSNRLAAA